MKKFGLITTTLLLFAASLYLAFVQGGKSLIAQKEYLGHLAAPADMSPVLYTGIRAQVVSVFAKAVNGFLWVANGNILLALILLALVVELVLLYPAIRVQLKQKKIHLFHKKLVDRFNRGELSVSETQHELHKLYAVNEKIHSRGALFVTAQVVIFLAVLWGINLLVSAPYFVTGSWSVMNFSLLSIPANFVIPLLAALLYFLHGLIKVWHKEREDYISPAQSTVAILFAVVGSTAVYFFSSIFAVALTLYFVTLITFATLRYLYVEQNAKSWGKFAQHELIHDLRNAKLHKNKFQYLSYRWNHLPVVRHINFHLLEEAVSMSLGLMLALNFFGVFQGQKDFGVALLTKMPVAMADFPSGYRECLPTHESSSCSAPDVPSSGDPSSDILYRQISFMDYVCGGDISLNCTQYKKRTDCVAAGCTWGALPTSQAAFVKITNNQNPPSFPEQLPLSCCWQWTNNAGTTYHFQTLKDTTNPGNTLENILKLLFEPLTGCISVNLCLLADNQDDCTDIPGCTWNDPSCTGYIYHQICDYKVTNIPAITTLSCPDSGTVGTPIALSTGASKGTGFFEWTSSEASGSFNKTCNGGTEDCTTIAYTPSQPGSLTIKVADYYNSENSSAPCAINIGYSSLGLTCPTGAEVGTNAPFTVSGGSGPNTHKFKVNNIDGGDNTVGHVIWSSGNTYYYQPPQNLSGNTLSVKIKARNSDDSGPEQECGPFIVQWPNVSVSNCSGFGQGLVYGTTEGGGQTGDGASFKTLTASGGKPDERTWSSTPTGYVDTSGKFTVKLTDTNGTQVSVSLTSGGKTAIPCSVTVAPRPITISPPTSGTPPVPQPIYIGGGAYKFTAAGGPPNGNIEWSLDPATGAGTLEPCPAPDAGSKRCVIYRSTNNPATVATLTAKDAYYSDSNKASVSISYIPAVCKGFMLKKRTLTGDPVQDGFNMDVYPESSYRFVAPAENIVVAGAFNYEFNPPNWAQGSKSGDSLNVFIPKGATLSASLLVWDPSVENNPKQNCKVQFNLNVAGEAVTNQSPANVTIYPAPQ